MPSGVIDISEVQGARWTEKAFQRHVVDWAQNQGWRVYYTSDSRRGVAGWPDLVLVRDGVFAVAELKTDRGRLRPLQRAWLDDIARAGVKAAVWRPAMMQGILNWLHDPKSGAMPGLIGTEQMRL